MNKIFNSQKRDRYDKQQYDYYRTSRVMYQYFSKQGLRDTHDKINYRSMHRFPSDCLRETLTGIIISN